MTAGGAHGVVGLQTQVGGGDVLRAAAGVEDGAQVTQDADVGGGQVTDGDVAGGTEAQAAAAGGYGGGAVHGQGARLGVEADGAGGCGCHAYTAAKGDGVGCFKSDVTGGTEDTGVGSDIVTVTKCLDQNVAAAVGADGGVIGAGAEVSQYSAVIQGDGAVGDTDHDAAVAGGCPDVALGDVGDCCRDSAGSYFLHGGGNVADDEIVDFIDSDATASGAGG